jgi:DNA-binding transcriptional ArsR family regulator
MIERVKSSAAHDDRLDELFHALGDRTRRRLLARLARSPATVTELAAPFDMSLPAVSKHIRVLERAGLVVRAIEGRVHTCAFEGQYLRDAAAWLERYRTFWNDTLAALAEFAETGGETDDR